MVYIRRSRLSGKRQGRLIELFVAGATARAAAEIADVNRNTSRTFYHRLRQLMASKLPSPLPPHQTDHSESYFGGVRHFPCRGPATLALPVFGLLQRDGKVFTAISPNAKARTVLPIIREQVPPDSIVYTDSCTAYDVLDVSEFHHRRVNQSKVFVTTPGHHINGIEHFWNQAKRHLRRFTGLTPDNFYWFLKECEWRFNGGNHQQLVKQLKHGYKSTKHSLLAMPAPRIVIPLLDTHVARRIG